MSQSASVVWEVRPATGSDTQCGGGFDPSVSSPGTDYSQQNSAQVAYTDLVIGTTTTQLTSAGNPFSSADVGNVIQITSGSGFTTGFYTINSVSGTTATMDRAVGTASSTGGHGYLGGALATLGGALFHSLSGIPAAGQKIWLNGTQTITAAVNIGISCSGDRISIQGYSSTRGDSGHAALACSTNSVDMLTLAGISGFELVQVDITNTAGTPGNGIRATAGGNSNYVTLQNCVISGCAIGVDGNYAAPDYYQFTPIFMIEVEIKNCTSHGFQNSGISILKGCYSHNNTGDGFQVNTSQTNGISAYGCVSANNGGVGFNFNSVASITFADVQNCDSYNNTGDGLKWTGSSVTMSLCLLNNVFYGNGGYGINFDTTFSSANPGQVLIQRDNAFGSNTSGSRSPSNSPSGVNDISLTANPFNSPSTGDFSLNSTAGGGALLTGVGWQSSII